jgi:hypothetical protein
LDSDLCSLGQLGHNKREFEALELEVDLLVEEAASGENTASLAFKASPIPGQEPAVRTAVLQAGKGRLEALASLLQARLAVTMLAQAPVVSGPALLLHLLQLGHRAGVGGWGWLV